MKKIFSFFCLLIIISSCGKEYQTYDVPSGRPANSYSGKSVRNYFTLLCKISKSTPGFFPPEVSRAYGYVGIANYEVVVHGIPGARSLAGQLNGLSVSSVPQPYANIEYDWQIASNAAIADMIRKMFDKKITPANAALVDSTEQANLKEMSLSVSPEVANRSIQFGKGVSAAIYQYSINDGGHEAYLDPFQLPYSMPVDPACWVPTGAALHPVSPYWGNNRAFIPSDVIDPEQFKRFAFSTDPNSDFYKGAFAVYKQVQNNTAEQVNIAKYWSDDPFNTCTPTGHTFNIMTQLLDENKNTLEKTSVAYARLCIAETDAFITCWKAKYKSVLIRPVSYIKQYIDPSFATVIGTPAFPSFVSGHSAEIGSGEMVFTDMFTDGSGNYSFTDYSQLQYGFAPRSYTSFKAMAKECADSRFYAGIHFQMDNEQGLLMGEMIGGNVNKMISWPRNIK